MISRRSVLAMVPAAAAADAVRIGASPSGKTVDSPIPPTSIPLWPGPAPGDLDPARVERVVDRSADARILDRAVTGISRPRLLVYSPVQSNGAALLVLPGGGYQRVVLDREGIETARWGQARGFTVFVLLYRLPAEGWSQPESVALCDAQRAVRQIRARATGFGYDPDRVAVLGYSAGGHLCADLASRFAGSFYTPVDEGDRHSARPFCAAPIYPVVSMDPAVAHPGSRLRLLGSAPSLAQQNRLSPDVTVTADAPPHFLVHAEDDRVVPIANTLRLRAALVRCGVAVETHLFAQGGHGFGLTRDAKGEGAGWPDLWLTWMRTLGKGPVVEQSAEKSRRPEKMTHIDTGSNWT